MKKIIKKDMRDQRITIRLTQSEILSLNKQAQAMGLTLSPYMRMIAKHFSAQKGIGFGTLSSNK